jgi:phage terminase large subunit-like protein
MDKVARAYAIQPIFASGIVYAPDKDWADKIITQAEVFPKARHDDLVDSTTQALRYLREKNFLRRAEEVAADIRGSYESRPKKMAVYDV